MAHFYHPKTLELVDGLREARKVKALPSPSTINSLIKGAGLIYYLQRQMFDAAISTPRDAKHSDDEHYEACCHWADEHSQIARDKGSDFHSLIQSYNIARKFDKPVPHVPERWEAQYRAYIAWYEGNVKESLLVEQVVVGDGYAGRADNVVLLLDDRMAVVDAKTQGLKGKKKFNHYLSWAMQIGAYSKTDRTNADCLISLCFGSDDATAFEAYEWPEHPSYYHALFMGLKAIWNAENNYKP